MSNDPKRHGHAYMAVPSLTDLIDGLTPAQALTIVEHTVATRPADEKKRRTRRSTPLAIDWLPCTADE